MSASISREGYASRPFFLRRPWLLEAPVGLQNPDPSRVSCLGSPPAATPPRRPGARELKIDASTTVFYYRPVWTTCKHTECGRGHGRQARRRIPPKIRRVVDWMPLVLLDINAVVILPMVEGFQGLSHLSLERKQAVFIVCMHRGDMVTIRSAPIHNLQSIPHGPARTRPSLFSSLACSQARRVPSAPPLLCD